MKQNPSPSLSTNSLTFMKSEGSLPCSQEPATGPVYLQSAESMCTEQDLNRTTSQIEDKNVNNTKYITHYNNNNNILTFKAKW
jgi:hypothetical protein